MISESQPSLFVRVKSILTEIKQSIAGVEVDYTSISIRKALVLLSIPMVLEMLMESVFIIFDIYFVSKLGAEAVAIVGLTESIVQIIYAFGIGFAIATTALVSRRIGEKDPKRASHAAFQAILVAASVSIVISIVGLLHSENLLRLMGASPEGIEAYSDYTRWMLAGNATIMLLFILNGIFRGAGDAAIAMRVLWIANIINIVLDPMLIFGIGPFPELGVKGAAIATNIGRGTAVIYQLYLLFVGRGRIKLLIEHLKPNFKLIQAFLKLSYSGILQFLIATSSWIFLVRIISEFGSVALAGYTIGIRVIVFALLPAFGLSNAVATLVGQNLGANNPGRAEQSAWIAAITNSILLSIIGIAIIIWTEPILSIFTHEEDVISKGAECLRIISIGFIAYGFGMVMLHGINGAGDTFTPMVINFFCFWVIQIPLAYVLAIQIGMEEKGVYLSILIAESILTLVAAFIFRRGRWKVKKV